MIDATANSWMVIEGIQDQSRVAGYTHAFYRYPARFSPRFAEAAITAFTKPGEVVYDPFMGGGTTLVEAMRLGRKCLGTDINSLAVFISRAKTTIYTDSDIAAIREWVNRAQKDLVLTNKSLRPEYWISRGYQRNISGRLTWPTRKTLELALANLELLNDDRQRLFVRCLLLKTAQWALDCRKNPPSARFIRERLVIHAEEMIQGALALRESMQNHGEASYRADDVPYACVHAPVQEIATRTTDPRWRAPKLILTSPPYPGVHVLYHRWQVLGRRETPAPYWIADCHDGHGASFYTMGGRQQRNLGDYYENLRQSYEALSSVADKGTWLVQLVAFSSPEWQLPLFLDTLRSCGFSEVTSGEQIGAGNHRVWRTVPNRKFYATHRGTTSSSREVLLIHQRI